MIVLILVTRSQIWKKRKKNWAQDKKFREANTVSVESQLNNKFMKIET
mgnify:CR=1 FL=1